MKQTASVLTGDREGEECPIPEPGVPGLSVKVREAHPLLPPAAVTDRPDTDRSPVTLETLTAGDGYIHPVNLQRIQLITRDMVWKYIIFTPGNFILGRKKEKKTAELTFPSEFTLPSSIHWKQSRNKNEIL